MKAILTYHSIDDSGSPISIPEAGFAQHHAWFIGGRVRVVSLDELPAWPDEQGDAVAVTFDDAFRNCRAAADRLLSDGLPVTVFVVTARVGERNDWGGRDQPGIPTLPLMDWTELERLASRGARIEAHSRTHPPLTRLSRTEQDEELLGCRQDLEQHLGVRSTHFCYPYGDVDESLAARTERVFPFGYSTDFRVLTTDDAPLRLPRLDAFYFRDTGTIETWGSVAFQRRVRWCRLRRRAREILFSRSTVPASRPRTHPSEPA